MNAAILSSTDVITARNTTDASMVHFGGTSWRNGSYLHLTGNDKTGGDGGHWYLCTTKSDGSDVYALHADRNGSMNWTGNNFYLQEGAFYCDTNHSLILSGDASSGSGAYIRLGNSNSTAYLGGIELCTRNNDGGVPRALRLEKNTGRAIWNGAFTSTDFDDRGANIRVVNGNYSFMIRNDGANTYFLMTAPGDPWGQWREDAHPLWINNDSRIVSFGAGVFSPYFQITSDRRLKSDLKKIDSALEKVAQLAAYSYMKQGVDKRQVGVIAQDVEKVLPEAVGENDEGYKTVDYSAVTALLVNAIKELREEVNELRSEIHDR